MYSIYADFDGDQMAVHVPLGQEAILKLHFNVVLPVVTQLTEDQ